MSNVKSERHLELKVGAMVIVALVIMVVFILILGDWTFKSRKMMEVFFQNPGGLTSGSTIKVSGRKVGVIKEMTFLGQTGPKNPATRRRTLVRVRISINEEVVNSLRRDTKFYITTKGVLGDPYLEIEPGILKEALDISKPAFGIDPPRLDLFVADAYKLVKSLTGILERNEKNIDSILGGGARLINFADKFVDAGIGDGQSGIINKVEKLIDETTHMVSSINDKYVDNPKIDKIVNNLNNLLSTLNRRINPLLDEVTHALGVINDLGDTIGPKEREAVKAALLRMDNLTLKAEKVVNSLDTVMDKIKRGEGTVGQMLADEEIYDDIKELIRDIKRHPWKLIWED